MERVQDWLNDVHLDVNHDMDVEEWACFETLRLKEEDKITEARYEGLYEDGYFDTLEREEKEIINEGLYEDAYFDTLERQEF